MASCSMGLAELKQQLLNNILHPIITVDMLRINAAEDPRLNNIA
jgi:hypothetical protein